MTTAHYKHITSNVHNLHNDPTKTNDSFIYICIITQRDNPQVVSLMLKFKYGFFKKTNKKQFTGKYFGKVFPGCSRGFLFLVICQYKYTVIRNTEY